MAETDDLPPDPVIEAYKKDVDRTLIRENLRRTPEERLRNLFALQRAAEELRRAGCEATKLGLFDSPPESLDPVRGLNFTLTATLGDIDIHRCLS